VAWVLFDAVVLASDGAPAILQARRRLRGYAPPIRPSSLHPRLNVAADTAA
jgi:hypothetical protein